MGMAFNFGSVSSLHPNLSHFVSKNQNHLFFFFSKPSSSSSSSSNSIHFYSSSSSPFTVAIHSEGTEGEVTDDDEPPGLNGSLSSARTQLDLLEQLSSASDGASNRLTIREQLLELVGDREGEDFSIRLGKKNLKKSVVVLNAPVIRRKQGRPRRKRRRSRNEQYEARPTKVSKCSTCGHDGHYKTTCMGGPTAKERAAQASGTTNARGGRFYVPDQGNNGAGTSAAGARTSDAAPKKRGRPKGSQNKPKEVPALTDA